MIRTRHLLLSIFEAALVLALSVIWCEFGYYYFTFYINCPNWPGGQTDQNYTKVLVLADTHIMGPIKSVKFDKVRREWQMRQAYGIALSYYRPDTVIFLGDIFDEASFSHEEDFEEAYLDYQNIFPYDRATARYDRIIIAGNHDIGFHDQMKNSPSLLNRFYAKFYSAKTIEPVNVPSLDGLNFISSNSMSFYNDTCPICSESIASTNIISGQLADLNKTHPENFSRPVLLIHIPLYRLNDTMCVYPDSLRKKSRKENIEGEDVLHKVPSKFLVNSLRPRLILSGHTHMLCHTLHQESSGNISTEALELTISSFNHKYAEKKPGFLLLSINRQEFLYHHCDLVEEWVIASIYVATIIIITSRLIINFRKNCRTVIYVG